MNSSSGIRNTWTFRLCQSRESRLSAEAISRLSVPPQFHEFVNHMFRGFINFSARNAAQGAPGRPAPTGGHGVLLA